MCLSIQEQERQRRLKERARALIAEARASQDLPEMKMESSQGDPQSPRLSSREAGRGTQNTTFLTVYLLSRLNTTLRPELETPGTKVLDIIT